jgi:hypothetical protein
MSDDFIMLVYMLVYEMFIGVCLLCFGAVLTLSLLSVTQRALTSKALRRLFDPNHRPEENGSEWRAANSEWFSGGQCSRTAENFRHFRRCALQSR